MRQFSTLVFDDTITGTSTSWVTSASHNDQLGSADFLTFHGITTGVAGTTPTLTCRLEHSADGRSWVAPTEGGDAELNEEAIQDDQSVLFRPANSRLLSFVRVQISLGAASGTPQCRLKLYATGRVLAASQRGNGRGVMRTGAMR